MKTNLIMGLLLAFLVGCGVPEADGGGSTTSVGYIRTSSGKTLIATGLIKKSTFDKDKMTINNSSYMKIRGR